MNRKLLHRLLVIISLGLSLVLASAAHAQRMPQDNWYLAKQIKFFGEPGKFYHPQDASVGPDGNLYVADRYNHRVQVFDQDGNFIRQIGNYGIGNGQFRGLTGVHVAPDGKVYVCDEGNGRVQVFNSQWRFIGSIGKPGGTLDGLLDRPYGVTVDDAGNIYIAEQGNARVSVFKPDGTFLRKWGSAGSGDGQFQVVNAICRTPDNKIAVLERDGNRRIQVFEPDGTFIDKFSTENSPHGIETDLAGNFYITARDWAGFSIFDSTGKLLAVHGRSGSGSGDGQFNPSGLAVGNGRVFICDSDNHRITIFTDTGAWISHFGSFSSISSMDARGIAVDANGNVYICHVDSGGGSNPPSLIFKLSPDLNFVKSFGVAGSGDGKWKYASYLAIGPNQRLYVVDSGNHRVQYFDLDGNFLGKFGGEGTGNGNFQWPFGIAFGKNNKVYITDRENRRVQIFDLDGNFLGMFGSPGTFDGQFENPVHISVAPDGTVAVVDDSSQDVIKLFSPEGEFKGKFPVAGQVDDIHFSTDGVLYASVYDAGSASFGDAGQTFSKLRVYSLSGSILKQWACPFGKIAENERGDLITVGREQIQTLRYDRGTMRIWKRTFRAVHPEPANALPLPAITDQKVRPGTSLVDVDYLVKDADDGTVHTAALAFKDGGNSLSDVIPVATLAEGTGNKLGANIATGQTHRFTWDAARDWSTDFGEAQIEILAKDGRGLLSVDFIEMPATGEQAAFKISRSPLNDNDLLSIWYWLIATADPGIQFANGTVLEAGAEAVPYASGTTTTAAGRAYLFQRMGLREATTSEVTFAKEAGTPGLINQWDPKLRVGPDERPAKINAYGFDTGADGYWVVPVSGN